MNEMNQLFRRHRKSSSMFGRSRFRLDSSLSGRPRDDRTERLQRTPEIDGHGEAKQHIRLPPPVKLMCLTSDPFPRLVSHLI